MSAPLKIESFQPATGFVRVPIARSERLRGIDSIRFLCALIVVHNHMGNPNPLYFFPDTAFLRALMMFGRVLFFAPAAVIIFFVLSGLCIHYPYRHGEPIEPLSFILKRLVRVALPLALATPFGLAMKLDFQIFNNNILWSLFAEIIYYTLYPTLMRLKTRMGWPRLLGTTFAVSLVLFLLQWDASEYPAFGVWGNWLAGLPCWLLGVRLAECVDDLRQSAWLRRFLLRGSIIAGMSIAIILHFHTRFTNPFVLNLYAILAFFWLREEVAHFKNHKPWQWLESLGKASYSLYLTHLPIIVAVAWKLPIPFGRFRWFGILGSALVGSWVFYWLVEKPCHKLAQMIPKRLRRPRDLSASESRTLSACPDSPAHPT
ncbi:MAG: acyltransferase [Deltaproteobacteria bacterium]|nr:acyltransferase [Deltaproteobacteria bacterium]MBI3294717.1 acyltransferase [Deltaproteobacteria bacterium]